MDLPPNNTGENQGVELQHVNVVTTECRENPAFTIESEGQGPPRYSNKQKPGQNTKQSADWKNGNVNGHVTTINVPQASPKKCRGRRIISP